MPVFLAVAFLNFSSFRYLYKVIILFRVIISPLFHFHQIVCNRFRISANALNFFEKVCLTQM